MKLSFKVCAKGFHVVFPALALVLTLLAAAPVSAAERTSLQDAEANYQTVRRARAEAEEEYVRAREGLSRVAEERAQVQREYDRARRDLDAAERAWSRLKSSESLQVRIDAQKQLADAKRSFTGADASVKRQQAEAETTLNDFSRADEKLAALVEKEEKARTEFENATAEGQATSADGTAAEVADAASRPAPVSLFSLGPRLALGMGLGSSGLDDIRLAVETCDDDLYQRGLAKLRRAFLTLARIVDLARDRPLLRGWKTAAHSTLNQLARRFKSFDAQWENCNRDPSCPATASVPRDGPVADAAKKLVSPAATRTYDLQRQLELARARKLVNLAATRTDPEAQQKASQDLAEFIGQAFNSGDREALVAVADAIDGWEPDAQDPLSRTKEAVDDAIEVLDSPDPIATLQAIGRRRQGEKIRSEFRSDAEALTGDVGGRPVPFLVRETLVMLRDRYKTYLASELAAVRAVTRPEARPKEGVLLGVPYDAEARYTRYFEELCKRATLMGAYQRRFDQVKTERDRSLERDGTGNVIGPGPQTPRLDREMGALARARDLQMEEWPVLGEDLGTIVQRPLWKVLAELCGKDDTAEQIEQAIDQANNQRADTIVEHYNALSELRTAPQLLQFFGSPTLKPFVEDWAQEAAEANLYYESADVNRVVGLLYGTYDVGKSKGELDEANARALLTSLQLGIGFIIFVAPPTVLVLGPVEAILAGISIGLEARKSSFLGTQVTLARQAVTAGAGDPEALRRLEDEKARQEIMLGVTAILEPLGLGLDVVPALRYVGTGKPFIAFERAAKPPVGIVDAAAQPPRLPTPGEDLGRMADDFLANPGPKREGLSLGSVNNELDDLYKRNLRAKSAQPMNIEPDEYVEGVLTVEKKVAERKLENVRNLDKGAAASGQSHYRIARKDINPEDVIERVYVNPDPEHAAKVWNEVAEILDKNPDVPFAKIAGYERATEYTDGLVIYTNSKKATQEVVDKLDQIRKEHPEYFRPDVPRLTEQRFPGVSVGDEPNQKLAGNLVNEIAKRTGKDVAAVKELGFFKDGFSFSSARATATWLALDDLSRFAGKLNPKAQRAYLERQVRKWLEQAGIDPLVPSRNIPTAEAPTALTAEAPTALTAAGRSAEAARPLTEALGAADDAAKTAAAVADFAPGTAPKVSEIGRIPEEVDEALQTISNAVREHKGWSDDIVNRVRDPEARQRLQRALDTLTKGEGGGEVKIVIGDQTYTLDKVIGVGSYNVTVATKEGPVVKFASSPGGRESAVNGARGTLEGAAHLSRAPTPQVTQAKLLAVATENGTPRVFVSERIPSELLGVDDGTLIKGMSALADDGLVWLDAAGRNAFRGPDGSMGILDTDLLGPAGVKQVGRVGERLEIYELAATPPGLLELNLVNSVDRTARGAALENAHFVNLAMLEGLGLFRFTQEIVDGKRVLGLADGKVTLQFLEENYPYFKEFRRAMEGLKPGEVLQAVPPGPVKATGIAATEGAGTVASAGRAATRSGDEAVDRAAEAARSAGRRAADAAAEVAAQVGRYPRYVVRVIPSEGEGPLTSMIAEGPLCFARVGEFVKLPDGEGYVTTIETAEPDSFRDMDIEPANEVEGRAVLAGR